MISLLIAPIARRARGLHHRMGLPAAVWMALLILATVRPPAHGAELASWKDSPRRQAVIDFVTRVTREGSPDFVPVPQRIAVFDNDGTLWAEQPLYFQALFILDRVRTLAPRHPEWSTKEPFASALKGDLAAVAAGGTHALLELLAATHAGMTQAEFDRVAGDWLASARHPKTGRRFTEMVYQPMLELLDYLRKNGFQTWIVTGGGIEFVRLFSERVYGIPPEQVIGSSLRLKYEVRDGVPTLVRLPEINFIDDRAGKPVGIQQHLGRRPLLAVGNSDGDFEMLEWTTAGPGPRFGMLIRHTDAEREWAYDRESHIGKLQRGLDEAAQRGWQVVDMRNDWTQVFPAP